MKVVFALLAVGAIPVAAQVPSTDLQPAAQFSALRGVAVDSVRGGFLKGASVGVLGPSRMGITDSLGRFFIDSIPPGEYTVALFDSFLDSLSISVVSPPTRFAVGTSVALILAIPSPPTIVTAKCGPLPARGESAALFGRVFRASDGAPVEGADIRLEWLDVAIDRESGVKTTPRRTTAKSDSTGRYRICLLPPGVIAELSASFGGDSTGSLPIDYGDSHLGIADLFLPGSTNSRASRVTGTLRGKVVDSAGRSAGIALVTLSSKPTAITTGADGTFDIGGLRLGTQTLLVRRLGYRPVEMVVNVTAQPSPPVIVQMDQFVPILESVVIGARRSAALEEVGFARRKRFGLGSYWEANQLRDISSLDNFMQTIPVLRRKMDLPRVSVAAGGRSGDPTNVRHAGPGSVGAAASRTAGASTAAESSRCPRTFLDGVEIRGGIGGFVMPGELAAIEVYSAIMTPAEFRGLDHCPTILVWTDRRLSRGF